MSNKNQQFYLIIFSVLVFFLCETHFTTEALTDEQRKEVKKLRADLEDGFDQDEERTMKEHGVIVQPSWTQDHKSMQKIQSKVVVTNQKLKEAKALREEINKAVKQDIYTPQVGRGHIGADTHVVQELHHQFVSNANNQKSATVTTVAAGNPNALSTPNVIEASSASLEPDIDIRKLQRLELNRRRTKEALVLEFIEEDFSFTQGEHVQEWEHILHGGEEYFIGRLEQDLQIVHKNAVKYEAGAMLNIGAPITYLETYSFWNLDKQQQEGIILVATDNKVLWYRADEGNAQITNYWEWVVGNEITGLTYFTADAQDFLVISSNQSSRAGYYALNIYQFELKNKEFWIAQRLQLEHPCGEVTFLNTGRDFILAVAQNNTAIVYAFNPHTEGSGHLRFQSKYKFESEGIEYITAFQMGGRSYLALGGLQPQILLYQHSKFVPKTIFGNNFGLVEFFFPIPVRTYRDDLILLVQHRVDFSTHKLTVLETLIWDGEAFEATVPAPCKLGSHTVHGVGCMLDLHRDAGLKGAALLRRGDEISVIVPRHEAESGLFRLHTKLLAKNSELTDLQQMLSFLKEWVAEQVKLIEQAQTFLNEPTMPSQTAGLSQLSSLEKLETPELYFNGVIKQLYVNDYKWTLQDSLTDLDFVMNEIEQLGYDLGANQRQRRDVGNEPQGHDAEFESLELNDVLAEFLHLKNLNGEKFFIAEGQLDFEGILNLVDLEVLEAEALGQNRRAISEELSLNQDLEFQEINGIPWSDIAENLVFRNNPVNFENLNVDGHVIVEDLLNVKHLNALKFPDDYLWSEGIENQIVTAPKNFTNTLAANHVDTEGVINGIDPLDAITLSDPQNWNGMPTFAQLEVSELLELNGTARGRGVEEFPSNPTLEEAKIINANCEFSSLKVLGPVEIEDNFNKKPLSMLLNDIIQRPVDPSEEIIISSPKTFSDVYFPIDFHVLDDAINKIYVDEFMPQHTTQELNITKLAGNSFFNNLTISGTYDGVNIKELLNNTINIKKLQVLPKAQLNFINMVNAKQVNVIKTLNGVPISTGFQTINEKLQIPAAHFENLRIVEASIHGTTQGTAKLNGFNIFNSRLEDNGNEPPIAVSNIFVDELILEQGLEVDEIQSINAEFLYNFLDTVDDLPEMILDGKVHVDHIVVTGNVQVNKLNGQHFDEDVQMTAVWLNRPNYLNTNLQFTEPVDLQTDLVVLGDYNGQNLPDLIDNMVFREPNATVLIWAPKNFLEPITVLGNAKLDALNGMPLNHIATKRNVARFKGHLKINGDVSVQNLHVNGSLNDFFMSNITDLLYFDRKMQAFVLHGVSKFSPSLSLNDLTVLGNLNEFEHLERFFQNVAYKQDNCLLNGQYNFTGRVSIERGVYIDQLNGHHLLDLFNNIIFISGLEPIIIDSAINFTASIKTSTLNVQGALVTHNISGCNISDWLNDTLRLDRAESILDVLRFSTDSLHGNKFCVNFLNKIDLSKTITVHTPQNFTSGTKFSKIILDGSISSKGLINGADLQYEFESTVFTHGDRSIKTPLKIQKVNVLGDIETIAPINGDKDLKNIATLYEDVELESPLYFENLQVKNLATDDLISGIDFEDWYEQALWLKGRPYQYITGNWSVRMLNLQNGPKSSAEIVGSSGNARESKLQFNELCQQMKQLWLKLNERPYYLRYLKKSFEVDIAKMFEEKQQAVKTIFVLQYKKQNFILVNLGCRTKCLKWQPQQNSFEVLDSFETGYLRQAVMVNHKFGGIQFVTNSFDDGHTKCNNTGIKLWLLRDDSVEQLKSFEVNTTQIWSVENQRVTFEGLKQLSASENLAVKIIKFDDSPELVDYSFIGYGTAAEMYFTNGTHIIEISSSSDSPLERRERSMPARYNFYTNNQRSVHTMVTPPESVLQPNETVIRKLSFADFSLVIERILEDLDDRLSIEVNITQLGSPETDLYDAHLIEDFVAIMEELRSQNIYPPNSFADVDLANLKIPENPAQVLAARTVQISWPIIVEIHEVHRYLQGNNATAHPTSGCILNHLGTAIHEILLAANNETKQQANATFDYAKELSAVIHRIRKFQADLKALKTELKLEIFEDLNAESENELRINYENMGDFEVPVEKTSIDDSSAKINDQNSRQNFPLKILRSFIKENNTGTHGKDNEILKLVVGSVSEPRTLLAVIRTKTHLAPGEPAGLNFYTDLWPSQLFQFIPAHKARFLSTLRIRDLTFLAYVEHCCLVNVPQYRGVEGFVDFVKFTTDAPVLQLSTVSLPTANSKLQHYLIVVFKRKIVFYEFVFAGLQKVTLEDLNICT